mmetsp:Transcript_98800/g.308344  ORF Transcript_98800/g.308344 Transcript_98800/m.308344 type:complete len:280 (+) Transcript_98800:64-903(+)
MSLLVLCAVACLLSAQLAVSVSVQHPANLSNALAFLDVVNTTKAVDGGRRLMALVEKQVEYEFSFSQAHAADVPKVNKALLVLLSSFLGICGFDRCLVGAYITGTLKALTIGCFGIWAFVDLLVVLANAFAESDSINQLGFVAKFQKDTIQTAYYVAICAAIYHVAQCFSASSGQERAVKAHANNAERVPSFISRAFRKGGLLPAKPSVPELKALFTRLDADSSGTLSKDELRDGLANIGVSPEQISEMVKQADLDGDGEINLWEFIGAFKSGDEDSNA